MTGHHDVGRGLSGAGEREGSPKASAKDGPGGAHVCAIYVRIRDGVSSDRRALCATGWLGGTRRGRAWKAHLTPPCPVPRRESVLSGRQGHLIKKGERMPSRVNLSRRT